MKHIVSAGLAGLGIAAAVALAPTATATPDYRVCDTIDANLATGSGYLGYLTTAINVGAYLNYDAKAQAQNILDSVVTYCPQHRAGISNAAAYLLPQYAPASCSEGATKTSADSGITYTCRNGNWAEGPSGYPSPSPTLIYAR